MRTDRSARHLRVAALAAAIALGAAASPALAADKQAFLGQHGDWYAYRLNEDGARTCYMVSKPTRTKGKFKKRGDVVVFVTHRPKEGERDVVNFQAGFTLKTNSPVFVAIGDKTFSLFPSKDTAWSRKPDDDKALVASMIGGSKMDVKSIPARGDAITDTYSLQGFTAAYKKITRACGLK
ncbi:MAG: invasion associated locus B family protein [Alphaproteobacteria bacterium]